MADDKDTDNKTAVPAPHTSTKSNLSPTSEFTRLFLLAWIVRYIPRGIFAEMAETRTFDFIKDPVNKFVMKFLLDPWSHKVNKVLTDHWADVLRVKKKLAAGGRLTDGAHLGDPNYLKDPLFKVMRPLVREWRGKKESAQEVEDIIRSTFIDGKGRVRLGKTTRSHFLNTMRERLDDIGYSVALGLGSGALSLSYSNLVRKDIRNIYREAVAYEKDMPQEKVTFGDIRQSKNKIIQRTISNHNGKLFERLGTDLLFFLAAPLKTVHLTDVLLGFKGLQIFSETWGRKPTMFEHLVGFINSKIHPRTGLGQPITTAEIFDLYQHYADDFHQSRMFKTVIGSSGVHEHVVWEQNQPIFERIADLMNKTYAYKHKTVFDADGHAVTQADFALPKFIYLLGNDMIDIHRPERSMLAIELANAKGIPAVKDMEARLNSGETAQQIAQTYGITLPKLADTAPLWNSDEAARQSTPAAASKPAPMGKIKAETIAHEALAPHTAQLNTSA